MHTRACVAMLCLAFAAPALGQDAEDRADTFLDIMVPPLTLRTTADTGELIELEISNTGFLELQLGDEVELPPGSEAQLRLGTSAVGVAGNGPATRVRVVEATADRQTVALNDAQLSMRDGTLVDVSTTSDGRAWAAMQYGSLNVYGPEAEGASHAIRLLAADLPRKFDAKLTKGQTLNLRVVDGKGSFTSLAGTVTLTDGDGKTLKIEEGQTVPADAQQQALTTTLTVQGLVDEPITVQRGEAGKLENIDDEITEDGKPVQVDLQPNDLVTMGEGARAEVKVGGSFVKLTEFTTFAVNALDEKVANVNVLGVDLELDTVTIIEVGYGSLYVNVESGTLRAVADSGAPIQNFFVTLPSGESVQVEVQAGGSFQVQTNDSGGLSFSNPGGTPVVIKDSTGKVVSTIESGGTADSGSIEPLAGGTVTGEGGTVVTEETPGDSPGPTPGGFTPTNDPGAPIPGTNVVKDDNQGVGVVTPDSPGF